MDIERSNVIKKKQKLEDEMKKQQNKQLVQDNVQENRNIKRLEKQLGLNKHKSKTIPKSFVSDGLDCILYKSVK